MIRKFKLEDKDKYIAMSKAFYCSDAVLNNIPDEYICKTFDKVISAGPYIDGYIFESSKQIAGYALLAFSYSNDAGGLVLWIEELYILPEYQGNGYGTELLKFISDTYKNKVARIRLEVVHSNQKAIKLYGRNGFENLDYIQMFKQILS